ncbi:general transcription factor 3C polypeptide 3 isoform X1 [Histomonas meleagridis]|uniref:general transcription factor 3C polypeptide 3 isoform X1 n=1 Tax=Histomonas meleagridis TaxID=135588 RepID=UPI0035598B8F|nr:general transcription factor 3C polypeptide 3 isoform X1 [Histomonas meleagridis]KAH0799282.1 general transcription factor 3C polypeptide 3 isoform X1 [Histomonas meleagridis]
MDNVEKYESKLDEIAELDDIPEEVLNEFVDDTQNFFDSYVSTRIEMKTIQEMDEAEYKGSEAEANRRKRRRRLGENLPEDVAFIIKNAYSEYFDGNLYRATVLAEDAISQNPRAPEPYNLLALISEEQESPEKALVFLVKAAELSTDATELWLECARITKQLGKLSQTASYLKKAAQSNPNDTSALLELYDLVNNQFSDNRTMIWTLKELTKRVPTEGKYAYELAMHQYQTGNPLDALKTLKNSIDAQIQSQTPISMENANLLASGYLNNSMNDEVILLDSQILDAPADFRANAGIAYLRKGDINEAMKCFEPLTLLSPSVFHDVFEAVTEELINGRFYHQAIQFLQLMQNDGVECREDIAFCYASSDQIDEAIDTLKSLILDNPALPTPPTTLYTLMRDNGREVEAIQWLEANCPGGKQSDEIILKRALIAHDNSDIDQFLELATPLLCRILYDIYHMHLLKKDSKSIEKMLGLDSIGKMNPFMMKILRYRRYSQGTTIPESQIFSLSSTCLLYLFNQKRLEEAFVLGGLLVICREKLEKHVYFDVLFMFALITFSLGDGSSACSVMRTVLLENNDNDVVWEFFNMFIQKAPKEENHTHKFLLRTLTKLPDCVPLQILLGNHSQSTIWFDHAIVQYLNAYKDKPDEPIITLLLCASYLSKAYVRTQQNPRKSVLCSYACIRKYYEARCEDFPAEADYNLGRFYHTLKMYPNAEKMYRKVLEQNVDYLPIASNENSHDLRYSLKRDAAYNLYLIYKESNPSEAKRIVRKYLVID